MQNFIFETLLNARMMSNNVSWAYYDLSRYQLLFDQSNDNQTYLQITVFEFVLVYYTIVGNLLEHLRS